MPDSLRVRPPRVRSCARRSWALALLGLCAACARHQAARAPGRDLLAQAPHELWSVADGWRLTDTADGETVAWSVAREAQLRLRLPEPVDTELELELVPAPGRTGGTRLGVRLNGQELGDLELASKVARHALKAPASLWRPGANVLSFTGAALEQAEPGAVLFGLASVRYAARELRLKASPDPRLRPQGGRTYRLETLAPGELELAATVAGEGELELVVRGVDVWSGTARAEALSTRVFRAVDGELGGTCALPRSPEPLELELTWRSAQRESACELVRLTYAESAPVRRRSVLFVSIDTLSAQHMSLYGYARPTTPELSAFARDAILFQNCRANAPWTIPSYMSQFTGLLPSAHQLVSAAEIELTPDPTELQRIAPSRWTLAEFFRAAGYRTAAFVDNPWLMQGFGFTSGFDLYDTAAAQIPLENPEGGLRSIVPRVLAWLDGQPREEPFFLFVQAFDPHAPYAPTAPWRGRFGADGLLDPHWKVPVGREQAFAYGCIPQHVAGLAQGELAVAPLVAAYDEKVLEVDAAMAQLFAGLKQRGLYDEILIVFAADHGESTTGHELFFNHALLYNDALHVPLVVRLPGGEQKGRTIEPVVSLVDLYPTLLDFVLGDAQRGLHGSSLLPLMRAQGAARDVGYAELGMMEQASLESGGWKLIATQPLLARLHTQLSSPRLDRARFDALCPELAQGYFTDPEIARVLARRPAAREFLASSLAGPFFELYHLSEDPLETHDLSAEQPERVARMRATLEATRELGRGAQAAATFLAPAQPLDPAALEELKALGYGGDH